MKKFLCLTGVVLVGVLAFGASTAGAGEVRWFGGCWHGDGTGGTATTAPGPLTISFGWATNSVTRTQKFLEYQSVTYSVSVNGATPTTTTTTTGWGPITEGQGDSDGDGVPDTTIYVTRWVSPTLATLAAGDSAVVTASLKTSKTTWDTDKQYYKAGTELLGSGKTTCTITAQ